MIRLTDSYATFTSDKYFESNNRDKVLEAEERFNLEADQQFARKEIKSEPISMPDILSNLTEEQYQLEVVRQKEFTKNHLENEQY